MAQTLIDAVMDIKSLLVADCVLGFTYSVEIVNSELFVARLEFSA